MEVLSLQVFNNNLHKSKITLTKSRLAPGFCFKSHALHFKINTVRSDKFHFTFFRYHFCTAKQKLKNMKKIDLMLNVIRAVRIAIGSILVITMGLTIVIGLASCSKENNLLPAPATQPLAIVTKKVS